MPREGEKETRWWSSVAQQKTNQGGCGCGWVGGGMEVEVGGGPAFVYTVSIAAHTSPRYGEIMVLGDTVRISS